MFASLFARAVLAAVVLAACVPDSAEAGAGAGAGPVSARASLRIRVTVPAVLRVRAVGQPGYLAVGAADVERGFVDVGDAQLHVLSNLRGAVRLVASVASPFAEAVEITGLPLPLVAQPTGEAVLARAGGPLDLGYQVRYRIRLSRGTAPGLYPWPVFLTLLAS